MKTITFLFFIFHFSFFNYHLCEAQIIHVPDDYPSIQLGINAANPGDTVLVSDGIFYEQINFLGKKPLTVSSEFIIDGDTSHIDNTIIDGSQLTNADNASVVYFISGEDTTSILCGFTIRNGKGTYITPDNDREGGGIWISQSGAKIIHNRITHNILDDTQPGSGQGAAGGGIASRWEDADYWLVIENNIIDSNACISVSAWAWGGGIATSYNSRIVNNIISYNRCSGLLDAICLGGGIGGLQDVSWTTPVVVKVERNTITHNLSQSQINFANSAGIFFQAVTGIFSQNEVAFNTVLTGTDVGGAAGAYLFRPDPGSLVSNNVFKGNVSNLWTGGLSIENDEELDNTVLVENNYFFDNIAKTGGAFVSFSAPAILQNNIFRGNRAEDWGGAIYLFDYFNQSINHQATLVNNTFSSNSATTGGAIFSYNARILIFNSIFWRDSASNGEEIYINSESAEIAWSCINEDKIWGSYTAGYGIIDDDPLFEDTIYLKPWCYSPCIDMGVLDYSCNHGDYIDAPEYDITGVIRPQGLGNDMGAYDTIFSGVGISSVVSRQWSVVSYPNPTNGISYFAFHISQDQYITLKIYDMHGREIAVLADENLQAGEHVLRFDATVLPAGLYFYQLTVDSKRLSGGKLVKY